MDLLEQSDTTTAAAPEVMEDAQVQVRFVPSKMSVGLPVAPETPFAVPSSLGRLGLSELLNHIVGDSSQPRAYEFLINGRFLRTTIKTYLVKARLSGEADLTLEYIEALPPPQKQQSTPHPDWVSSIDASLGVTTLRAQPDAKEKKAKNPGTVPGSLTLTGCYDGIVRVWAQPVASAVTKKLTTATSNLIAMGHGHTAPVKSVRVARPLYSSAGINSTLVVSASQDRTLRLWEYSPASEQEPEVKSNVPTLASQLECKGVFVGDTGTFEVVETFFSPDRPDSLKGSLNCAFDGTGSVNFVSGSYDGKVQLWANSTNYLVREEEDENNSTRIKRVRGVPKDTATKDGEIPRYKAKVNLSGHKDAVSSLCWPSTNSVYSGSYDHTFRLWDLHMNQCVSARTTGHVSCCLSFSDTMNLLASGDQDGVIRLWDPRTDSGNSDPKLKLKSHPNWVSSVKWSPAALGAGHILASAGYDGLIKLWDIRSTKPLHSFQSSSERLMALDWIPVELPEEGATSSPCSLIVGGTSKTMDRVGWSIYV